ncbi:MAG: glycosyltransferase family 4 protein [bacterium]
MKEKSNIAFIVGSLNGGGAERVISEMANYWAKEGENVSILALKREKPFYSLHPEVQYIELGLAVKSRFFFDGLLHGIYEVKTIAKTLKRNNVEVAISFFADINVISVLAAKIAHIPVIISERSNPFFVKLSFKWIIARKWFYRLANFLVVQTEAVKPYYKKFGVKVINIPNPVPDIEADTTNKEKMILAVGRLEKLKGFELLMQAFKEAGLPDEWKLKIIGDGKHKETLIKYRNESGLKDKVIFPGRIKDMGEVYGKASVFVLSSRHEGFPNALIEAMSLGLPVISFNCNYGPNEIIDHRENGILVDNQDTNKLAKEIHDLVHNQKERTRLGKNASLVKEKYSQQKIMKRWKELIDSL